MGLYEQQYSDLRPAQRLAVDTIEGPLLVIAGPGTGKTHILSMRVAHILTKTDTLPQNILCLTFTESATRTLRDRLTNLIGQAAYDVTISTYHAFGSELQRRFPEYFTTQADMQPVDELGIDTIFRQILDELPYSNPLKYASSYVRDIKEAVSEAKRALLTPQDLKQIADTNETFILSMSPKVSKLFKHFERIDKTTAGLFSKLAAISTETKEKPVTSVTALAELWHADLEAALEAYQETGKTNPLTTFKNKWLVKNTKGEFGVDGMNALNKLRALADIYERYLTILDERQLYDYDDMILRAIKGLEDHDDLRFNLQEQYLYVLLDEFQDTNAAQLRLIELLTNNPISEGRPNVMAVGDDDQAIFAFQGADYSHMLKFNDLYQGVKVIALTENFRSHKDVLHVSHGIAEQIEERLHHKFDEINKVLVASNKKLPPKAVIERHEFKSDVAQFAWVAKQAKQLIDNGIPAGEIALLAPQHKYLEPAVAYLHAQGIAVRYEKRENVLEDPVVKELTVMARLVLAIQAADHAEANSLWPQVLSFKFWGLPTSKIWQLTWQAHDDHEPLTNSIINDRQTSAIGLFFVRLSLLTETENLETMLDYLIGVQPLELLEPNTPLYYSPLYAHYFGEAPEKDVKAGFWNLLSNLTVLRQHLRTYRADEYLPLSLSDFISFTDEHLAADIKILNTNPYSEGAEAVQLMTVYKAKGQEFAAVFVLACLDDVWGMKARGATNKIPLPLNLRHIRHAGSTNDEKLRMFYVALTRAKHHLYLTSYETTFASKTTTRLKYLGEAEDSKGKLINALLAQPVHKNDEVAPTLEELVEYWQDRHRDGIQKPKLKALLAPRLEKFQLSPTHLNSFTDVIYGGPPYFFLNTLLRFPKAPSPDGQYGNAMHETLEWIHVYNRESGTLPTKKHVLDHFERVLKSKRLSAHYTAQLIERGQTSLHAYLSQRGHTIRAENECEFNCRDENVFIETAHLSGKIDKLIIDKQNKSIIVVDYKTGKSFSKWINSEAKLHKYKQQLYLYKLLIEKSRTFAGYKVDDAYLEFVEPNEDGEITELHLSFDDTYLERVKNLVNVVWQHTHELNFPSIDNYDASAKGIISFEDDLLSGKL